jgi:hypothetical protein
VNDLKVKIMENQRSTKEDMWWNLYQLFSLIKKLFKCFTRKQVKQINFIGQLTSKSTRIIILRIILNRNKCIQGLLTSWVHLMLDLNRMPWQASWVKEEFVLHLRDRFFHWMIYLKRVIKIASKIILKEWKTKQTQMET